MPTATIILIRHAEHDAIGRILAGRAADIALNAHGREQARRLAGELAQHQVKRLMASPQLRARQTAEPIATACALPVDIAADFDELDYGEWTGRSFAELNDDPQWRRWNEQRATSRPPRGESMSELQARVLRGITAVATANAGETIVIVSHAEPIRAALLHVRGLSLDDFGAVPIEPASVTALSVEAGPDALAPRSAAARVTA